MRRTHGIAVSKNIAKDADGVETEGSGRWLFSAAVVKQMTRPEFRVEINADRD